MRDLLIIGTGTLATICYEWSIDWDKVPDWIQAIGAMIASIGLVYTLILQQRTLKEQQRITLIEQENFLNARLPMLELSNIRYTADGQDRTTSFDVFIKNNPLQRLRLEHNFPDYYRVDLPYIIQDVILPAGYSLSFTIFNTLSPVFVEVTEYTGNTIIIYFEDALGNAYRQLIIFKGSDLVFLHPAVRLKNVNDRRSVNA